MRVDVMKPQSNETSITFVEDEEGCRLEQTGEKRCEFQGGMKLGEVQANQASDRHQGDIRTDLYGTTRSKGYVETKWNPRSDDAEYHSFILSC